MIVSLDHNMMEEIIKDNNKWLPDLVSVYTTPNKSKTYLYGFYMNNGNRRIQYCLAPKTIKTDSVKNYGKFIVEQYKFNDVMFGDCVIQVYCGYDYEKAMEYFNGKYKNIDGGIIKRDYRKTKKTLD